MKAPFVLLEVLQTSVNINDTFVTEHCCKHCQHRRQAKTKGKMVEAFHRQVVKQDRKSRPGSIRPARVEIFRDQWCYFATKSTTDWTRHHQRQKSHEDGRALREEPKEQHQEGGAFNSFIIQKRSIAASIRCAKAVVLIRPKDICMKSSYGTAIVEIAISGLIPRAGSCKNGTRSGVVYPHRKYLHRALSIGGTLRCS